MRFGWPVEMARKDTIKIQGALRPRRRLHSGVARFSKPAVAAYSSRPMTMASALRLRVTECSSAFSFAMAEIRAGS